LFCTDAVDAADADGAVAAGLVLALLVADAVADGLKLEIVAVPSGFDGPDAAGAYAEAGAGPGVLPGSVGLSLDGTVKPRAAVDAYDCDLLDSGVILISVAFRSSVAYGRLPAGDEARGSAP
jgi:hypothetical protein